MPPTSRWRFGKRKGRWGVSENARILQPPPHRRSGGGGQHKGEDQLHRRRHALAARDGGLVDEYAQAHDGLGRSGEVAG